MICSFRKRIASTLKISCNYTKYQHYLSDTRIFPPFKFNLWTVEFTKKTHNLSFPYSTYVFAFVIFTYPTKPKKKNEKPANNPNLWQYKQTADNDDETRKQSLPQTTPLVICPQIRFGSQVASHRRLSVNRSLCGQIYIYTLSIFSPRTSIPKCVCFVLFNNVFNIKPHSSRDGWLMPHPSVVWARREGRFPKLPNRAKHQCVWLTIKLNM